MTIFYPDVYNGDTDYSVPAGTVLVVAKATEGIYYSDKSFDRYKTEAQATNAMFSGYHFLKQESSPEAQADYYFNKAGSIPCMLDVETEGGSRPGVEWCLRFISQLERRGGRVWSVYYPHWYWSLTGGNLASLGVPVVASEYRVYSDTDWPAGYGGADIQIWQYTSSPHDTNAYRGTASELAQLVYGDNVNPSDVWGYKNPNLDPIDMRQRLVNSETNAEQVNAKVDALTKAVAALAAQITALPTGGVTAASIADAVLAELKAKL